jgi:predicted GNAT family acetyltransferase
VSIWGEYYFEREGAYTIEEEYGLITYKFTDQNTCLVTNAFISKDHRNKGLFRKLTNRVIAHARENYCNKIMAVVDLAMGSSSTNIGIYILKGGMKIVDIAGTKMYLEKRI